MTPSLLSATISSRQKKTPKLSLVALMDIFTVLVFFLMFNVHSNQAIEQSRLLDLPLSAQAIDHLATDAKVDILEVPDENSVVFNGQRVELDDEFSALTALVQNYCHTSNDATSSLSDDDANAEMQEPLHLRCQLLAIEAPNAMPYPFVNRFVTWGKELGFQDIYLVVTQKK
ncbi:biopolymer transporter ExbD [Vibrio parahaemolyticus]|nr:biopolymer transporter ExbD [Vibrio parahaemolyticus]